MKPFYISIAILIATFALAAFPTHSNTVTVNMDKLVGNWDSFDWQWASMDSQTNVITVSNTSGAIDLSAGIVNVRIGNYSASTFVSALTITNATISNSNVTWAVSFTNVPNPGKYLCEGLYYEGTATNLTRSLWQGKITVYESLYRE